MLSDSLTQMQPLGNGPGRVSDLLPILSMVIAMPVGLYITGSGDLMKGSGSTSVFWSVCTAMTVGAGRLYARTKA